MRFFGSVGLGGALFWLGGCGWWCMGHYFGWLRRGEWGWGIILGGWGWMGKHFGLGGEWW